MLNVTDQAAGVLHQTLEQSQEDDSDILRVTVGDRGLGLEVSRQEEGDQVVEHGGRGVLAIEDNLARELDGATLDLQETPEGPRLIFEPPSQESPE